MSFLRFALSVITIATLLSGCARMTHLTRDRVLLGDNDNPESRTILIDAKQRAILASKRKTAGDKDNAEEIQAFCTEPSPDALSAIAASQGFSLNKPEALEVVQSLTVSEGASSIGLRTQSIQLMRDAMYRLCEGYMSGATNGASWQTLHRRFQSSMVAILAIEQITGVVTAQQVALGGEAQTGSPELIDKYTQKAAEAKASLKSSEAKLVVASADVTDKTTEKDKKVALRDQAKSALDDAAEGADTAAEQAALEKAQAELDIAESALQKSRTAKAEAVAVVENTKALYVAYESARKAALAGNGTTKVNVTPLERMEATKSIQAVAQSVVSIVDSTLNLDFSREACASVITNLRGWGDKVPESDSVIGKCLGYMEARTGTIRAQNELLHAFGEQISKGAQSPSAEYVDSFTRLIQEVSSEYALPQPITEKRSRNDLLESLREPLSADACAKAKLTVRSAEEGDQLSINGVLVGPTGPQAREVCAGPVEVVVSKVGVGSYQTRIFLQPDESRTINATLD